MNRQTLTYWYALAFMESADKKHKDALSTERKNTLYINALHHDPSLSIVDLFEQQELWPELGLTDAECQAFSQSYAQLTNYAFQITDLLQQGYDIISLSDKRYPRILKTNLKRSAPTLFFTKGNIDLLNQPMVDISDLSLLTNTTAQQAAQRGQVLLVSGFDEDIDNCTLQSVFDAGGSCVVVLPKGISTASSRLRDYYQPLIAGQLLVLSCYEPTTRFSKQRAVECTKIIRGLSQQSNTAQIEDTDNTKDSTPTEFQATLPINVHITETADNFANAQLLAQSATAVDLADNVIEPAKIQEPVPSANVNAPTEVTAPIEQVPVAPTPAPLEQVSKAHTSAPIEQVPVAPALAPIKQVSKAPASAPIAQVSAAPATTPIKQVPAAPESAPIAQVSKAPASAPIAQVSAAPATTPIKQVPAAPESAPIAQVSKAPASALVQTESAPASNSITIPDISDVYGSKVLDGIPEERGLLPSKTTVKPAKQRKKVQAKPKATTTSAKTKRSPRKKDLPLPLLVIAEESSST